MKNASVFSTLLAYYLPYQAGDRGKPEFSMSLLQDYASTYLRRNAITGLSLLVTSSALKAFGLGEVAMGFFLLSCVFGLMAGVFISQEMDNRGMK